MKLDDDFKIAFQWYDSLGVIIEVKIGLDNGLVPTGHAVA